MILKILQALFIMLIIITPLFLIDIQKIFDSKYYNCITLGLNIFLLFLLIISLVFNNNKNKNMKETFTTESNNKISQDEILEIINSINSGLKNNKQAAEINSYIHKLYNLDKNIALYIAKMIEIIKIDPEKIKRISPSKVDELIKSIDDYKIPEKIINSTIDNYPIEFGNSIYGKIYRRLNFDQNNELKYTNQLNNDQLKPMADKINNEWDNSDYILATGWKPSQNNPPVCKTDKICPVCPLTTSGYPVSVMNFDESRKVMNPDNINIQFIKEKLNNILY